ncbi:hypothetical protein PV325_005199 [Microctonus aethiopoides]|nr:hypothetical protein PV325_005199 [Microctonus aethiopoides]
MQMTRMLLQEPGWTLERKGSALFLRRDSSHPKVTRVCFRCDVEVREYERDEDYGIDAEQPEVTASPLAMCASCLAAICVTRHCPIDAQRLLRIEIDYRNNLLSTLYM